MTIFTQTTLIGSTIMCSKHIAQSLRPEEDWLIGLHDLMNPAAWPGKIHVSNDWEGYLAQNATA